MKEPTKEMEEQRPEKPKRACQKSGRKPFPRKAQSPGQRLLSCPERWIKMPETEVASKFDKSRFCVVMGIEAAMEMVMKQTPDITQFKPSPKTLCCGEIWASLQGSDYNLGWLWMFSLCHSLGCVKFIPQEAKSQIHHSSHHTSHSAHNSHVCSIRSHWSGAHWM